MFKGLQEKATSTFAVAQAAVTERVDTAKAGKKLLDEGGENAANALKAKKSASAIASTDATLTRSCQQHLAACNEAAALLRKAKQDPQVAGITAYEEFEGLAKAAEDRARVCTQMLEMLKVPLPWPSMTPAESDALGLVQVRGAVETTKTKTIETTAAATSAVKSRVSQNNEVRPPPPEEPAAAGAGSSAAGPSA